MIAQYKGFRNVYMRNSFTKYSLCYLQSEINSLDDLNNEINNKTVVPFVCSCCLLKKTEENKKKSQIENLNKL